MSDSARQLPARPSLGQLRKQAKDLLHAARAGDASASARIAAVVKESKRDRVILADAQLAVAREHGFASWAKLVHHVESLSGASAALRPLIRPVELTSGRTWALPDGTMASTDDVFAMFVTAREGDLATVRQLVTRAPALAVVEYNYTPPIHFAVREGHRAIAEFLLDRGADPNLPGEGAPRGSPRRSPRPATAGAPPPSLPSHSSAPGLPPADCVRWPPS